MSAAALEEGLPWTSSEGAPSAAPTPLAGPMVPGHGAPRGDGIHPAASRGTCLLAGAWSLVRGRWDIGQGRFRAEDRHWSLLCSGWAAVPSSAKTCRGELISICSGSVPAIAFNLLGS